MKNLFWVLVLVFLFNDMSYSQTVYDDNYKENPNYLEGNKYLANSQYSSAINEYKKALRVNPNDSSSLIGLSNAYNMRAAYYNNTAKNIDKAISDLKSALFFLKYFAPESSSPSNQTLASIQKNLSILESTRKQKISNSDRFNLAKEYRTQGEFAAAGYDYFQIINDSNYSAAANSSLGDIYKIFNYPQKSISFYNSALSLQPQDSEMHLKLARTYELVNDYTSSLNEYSLALQNSSEKDEILSSLEKIWQKKVDEFPKDAEAHANLGVVFQKQKRYNEALTEYQKAEILNPSNINTKINIATLYQELNNYNEAVSVYDNILKLQPYNTKVLVYKAQCLKALKREDQAIDLYKAALSIEPNNAQIKAQLFDLLKNKMPAADLIAYLNKNSPMDANTLYNFAYELHKSGKIDDAIVYYLETIKLDNNKIDAYVNLSQAYRQKNDINEANNIINKAKEIAPNNELVKNQLAAISNDYKASTYNLASNLFQSGEYDKAINEYLKIDPPTVDSLIGIAAAYQYLADNNNAIDYYKKALELDNKNPDIPYYIASLYVNINDIDNAKKYADIALSLNNSNSQAKEILKYVAEKETEKELANAIELYNSQQYNDAVNLLNNLVKNDQSNYSVYYYRALSYDALNNYEKAVEDYKNVIKHAPDLAIAYYSLAVDYDNLNNYKLAKQNYKKYVDLNLEDNDYRKYALQRIDEIK